MPNTASPRFPVSLSLVNFAFTIIVSLGGAAVAVYATQATTTAKLVAVEQRTDKIEQHSVTREELEARLRAIEQQCDAIRQDLRDMRQDLPKR
jgi:Skp family chaperone for outer membrane proteins